MKYLKNTILLLFFALSFVVKGQEIPIEYSFGEKYNDKYKYSNLLSITQDGKGGSILVRAYYTGIILHPRGYFIEHYNENLELISEYNYKLKNSNFVESYTQNGQVYLLFMDYDYDRGSYKYSVHRSPIDDYNFTKETILNISSKQVNNPFDRNRYTRNFNKGFTSSILFNTEKTAFVISTHFKKGKTNQHRIHLFSASLNKLIEYDFSEAAEEKNYAFENMAISKDLKEVFLVGKAYYKKRRFGAKERKFRYELVKISQSGARTLEFDSEGKYSESLKPILYNGDLFCLGFYSNRKDNRYNGIGYFKVDPSSLTIKEKKYNKFSEQFMHDKFGREDDKEIKNLVFKSMNITDSGSILFNAEEYFKSTSVQANSSGGRVRVERFHHNDIVSVKLNLNGDMVWARNINKTEVTQGDGAYASYTSYTLGETTYFFISTASENPQQLSSERIQFKQGLSRNRNVFVIRLNEAGKMDFKKIIDSKDARLPLMVSKPLIDTKNNDILFYAKRGNKKQLVKVDVKNK